MNNIYSYWNSVWSDIQNNQKQHFAFIPITLYVITIPLSLGINNLMLLLLVATTLLSYKKWQVGSHIVYYLFVALFILSAISYFWSVDPERTLKTIPRNIYWVLLPILFVFLPVFTKEIKQAVLKYYSYSMVGYGTFYVVKAIFRFIQTGNKEVFFYHELVTKEVNAIHVSVYFALAFFYFYNLSVKKTIHWFSAAFLAILLFLLSSKLIIVVFVLLFLVNYFFFTKSAQKLRMRNLMIFVLLVGSILFFGKIKERFAMELQANNEKSISHTVLEMQNQGIHIVSVYEAWNQEKFSPNDFFPGTAFRVYQARMLKELLEEESPWLTGYGLEGSYKKLEEKAIKYNVFLGNENSEGYQKKNFHNQYLQLLADLGIFGLLLLVFILVILVKNAFSLKDFVPIAFTILMISLFLTESFLWRQRGIVFFTIFTLMMLPKVTKQQQ